MLVRFDPETGLIRFIEAMRCRDAGDEAKILWLNEPRGWQSFHSIVPSLATVTWLDQGTPWSQWTHNQVVYNVDVSE